MLAWAGQGGLFGEEVGRGHVGIGLELEEILVAGLGDWVLLAEWGWVGKWLEERVWFHPGYHVQRARLEGIGVGFIGKVESAHEVAEGRGEAWVGHLGVRVREFRNYFNFLRMGFGLAAE